MSSSLFLGPFYPPSFNKFASLGLSTTLSPFLPVGFVMDGLISYLSPQNFREWVSSFVVDFKSLENVAKVYKSLGSILLQPVRSAVSHLSSVFETIHSKFKNH